jgi:hypothetical protein
MLWLKQLLKKIIWGAVGRPHSDGARGHICPPCPPRAATVSDLLWCFTYSTLVSHMLQEAETTNVYSRKKTAFVL